MSLRSCLVAFASSALLTRVASPQARVQSTVSVLPTVAAAAANAISVSVSAGATQALASVTDNAPNTFPSVVTISLTWDLQPSTGSVKVLGYFADPTSAMRSGAVTIPSSWLKGR